jgi:hypothetical protein
MGVAQIGKHGCCSVDKAVNSVRTRDEERFCDTGLLRVRGQHLLLFQYMYKIRAA